MDSLGYSQSELVSLGDRHATVDPALDLEAQRAARPAGSGVDMGHPLDGGGGLFCADNHPVIHAVEEPVDDLAGHLVTNVADEQGDHEASDGVGPTPAQSHPDQANQSAGRGQRIEPRVLGVADQRGGLDTATDPELVAGDDLVADDAKQRSSRRRRRRR
jgi:hypothetical protein